VDSRRITLKEVVTNALRDNVPKLRYMMGERLNLKFVPQLIFQYVDQPSIILINMSILRGAQLKCVHLMLCCCLLLTFTV